MKTPPTKFATTATLAAAGFLTFFSANAFAQDADVCNCIGTGCGTGTKTNITNLKTPDIIVTTTKDNEALRRQILGGMFPGVKIVSGNIKYVIGMIKAHRDSVNRKVHVLVDGHGAPGRQQIGVEIIGHADTTEKRFQDTFVNELTGKLANLELLGCSVADQQAGQDFMDKMSGDLGHIPVKAFTGVVELQKRGTVFSVSVIDGEKKDVTVTANDLNPAYNQNWSDSTLITVNDDWSGVLGVVGYLGDSAAITTSNIDPRTITIDQAFAVDVNANRSDPNVFISGGVSEFEGPPGFNRVVALQGSGTADVPHLEFRFDTRRKREITISYVLRDIDGSADNAVQQFNAQYRVGDSGPWTNVPGTYVADATTGPNLATLVTPVTATLPPDADFQPLVEVRIMTTNAGGNDEWVGIDNISVHSKLDGKQVPAVGPLGTTLLIAFLGFGGAALLMRRRNSLA